MRGGGGRGTLGAPTWGGSGAIVHSALRASAARRLWGTARPARLGGTLAPSRPAAEPLFLCPARGIEVPCDLRQKPEPRVGAGAVMQASRARAASDARTGLLLKRLVCWSRKVAVGRLGRGSQDPTYYRQPGAQTPLESIPVTPMSKILECGAVPRQVLLTALQEVAASCCSRAVPFQRRGVSQDSRSGGISSGVRLKWREASPF